MLGQKTINELKALINEFYEDIAEQEVDEIIIDLIYYFDLLAVKNLAAISK